MTVTTEAPPTAPTSPRAPHAPSQRLLGPLHLISARDRFLAFFLSTFKLLAIASAAWLVAVLLLGSFRELPQVVALPLALAAWATFLGGLYQFFIARPARTRIFKRKGQDLSNA